MPTTDIADACKDIRDVWENIKNDFFEAVPGHYLDLTCVHRTPEEQFILFRQGRSQDLSGVWHIVDSDKVVTNDDGKTHLSPHNYLPARAIDVCVVDNQTGSRLWNEKWYKPLLDIAKRYNLVEGGEWRTIKDWPHLEVPHYKDYSNV